MRNQLLRTLRSLSEQHPEWLVHGLPLDANIETDDVAEFWVGKSIRVWATLLQHVVPTDVIRQGLLAHQRMQDRSIPPHACGVVLLVMSGLTIQQPLTMSTKVIITNHEPDVLSLALLHIAQRCRGVSAK